MNRLSGQERAKKKKEKMGEDERRDGEGVGKEGGGRGKGERKVYARLAPLVDLLLRFFPTAEPVHRLHD